MNTPKTLAARLIRNGCWILVAMLSNFASAFGQQQDQEFEITPLIGAQVSGSVDVQREGQGPHVGANLGNSVTFGLAAEYRYDGDDDFDFDENHCDNCSVVGIRWMYQNPNLTVRETGPVSVIGRPSVTLNNFLADFTHEWVLTEERSVRPFVTASLGAVILSTPAATRARFAFGLGTGVKILSDSWWGVRFQVDYLGMVMHGQVQRIVCAGGCAVVLTGGVMNQFGFSVGPIFRF